MSDELTRIAAGLDGALEQALDQAAEHAAGVARAHAGRALGATVHVLRTGPLARELVADAPYAVFVEGGRGAIQAAPGKVLHFVIGGRDVFAQRVGPAAPRPFMAPAAADLELEAPKFAQDAVDGLVGA